MGTNTRLLEGSRTNAGAPHSPHSQAPRGPRVTFARVPVDTGRILHVYTMFDLDKTGKV